ARVKVQPAVNKDEGYEVKVVSYNLYWWNVQQNNRWSNLHSRIRQQLPFDLIGFQECEDVEKTVRSAGLTDMDFYQGPSKPKFNPAPIA
ncbi:unnamed protein product, partial [Symbiodinium pilosum]